MSIESVIPSNHLILCHPLLLMPSVFPSIRVFSSESVLCMRWPKYWSFSLSISPSNEHPGLIFRMDWLYLLAVQGTLKSLLQYHSSKASILWRSAFFMVQLFYFYIYIYMCICIYSFPGGLVVKNLHANAEVTREVGSISGLGRSPGGGNGNPLQYSCLENSRGAWQAAVHGVTKSWTEHTCTQSSLINTTSHVIPSSSLTF